MGNGSGAVLARRVDGAQLECASAARGLGAARVSLSVNARQYGAAAGAAGGAARFTYQPASAASWLVPARALAEGGTAVTAHGSGFSSASEAAGYLLCRVGGAARRARWASARALSCAVGRSRAGEARLEASNNAREYSADAARLQLASVRVLDVQPWSGPRRGATVVGVRAVGAPAGGVRCAFGEAAAGGAWAGWRGGGASAASAGAAGAAASGVRCVSPASAVTGWVGVQLGGPAGLASSGGSFYYHGSLAVAGLSPPLGPERGGTRVAVAIASPSGGGGGGGGGARAARAGRPRRVDGALPDGQRLGRGAGAARGRRAAGVRVCGARAGRGARVALGERAAVRRGGRRCGRRGALHVPAGVGGELARAGARAGGGRHGGDGARQRLLVGVGGGGVPAVPRGRRGASRAVGERARALVRGGPVARAGEARLEASNNAREYSADAARLQLASVRVLDVQPWSGPRRGATVVGVRAVGAPAGGVRCAFGEAAAGGAWAGWRGGGASSASAGAAGAAASGVRCVSPASAVTGWVGVQLGGPAGLASSGGSFYYHGSLAVAGLSPPLGPERGGTRVAVAIASPSGGGGGGGRRRRRRRGRLGGRDASTVRCRMGNGSGAVLARRVDGAQLGARLRRAGWARRACRSR